MATGILAQAAELLKPKTEISLPSWGTNPADANLQDMAGTMQGATSYTPTDNALVSAQLSKLLSKDSDYMTRARTRAMQTASGRGLLNSSMAAGAGEAAAIDAGLPIAQQDATTFGTAERDNNNNVNQFARDSNAFGRDAALTKYKGVLDLAANQQGLELERGKALTLAASNDASNALEAQRNDLQGRQLDADTDYRNSDLDFRRGASDKDAALREKDLVLRQSSADKDAELRAQELALRDKGLTQDATQRDQAARTALQGDIAAIRRQASDAQRMLESDPNMSGQAKSDAILALGQKASADVAELVRFSGLDMPDAWPAWVNQIGIAGQPSTDTYAPAEPVPATPAQAPAVAPAPREDGINAANTPNRGAGSGGAAAAPAPAPVAEESYMDWLNRNGGGA